jgi:hypothetical protein
MKIIKDYDSKLLATFLTKIQNLISKKSGKEILLLSKFLVTLDGSRFYYPNFFLTVLFSQDFWNFTNGF